MPKYIVTSGSHFRPLSYDELVRPLATLQEQQNATQDVYDTLNLETNALEQYLEGDGNTKAQRMYKGYLDKLNSLQNNLWENGVTASTRRELAEARRGFGDIARLKKAITDRQTRSQAYWDYRHKNPHAIMGNDPGTSGIDAYLDDDNFGLNYFAYNGEDFMNEVAADAKARAKEYRGNPQFNKDVPGYITRVVNQGFTNAEVDAAVQAVRDGSYAKLSDGPVKILADTLAGHLSSTGAIRGQNVSAEEYDRLFGYGRLGLAQGIMEPDVKDFADENWRNAQDWAMWKRKQDYTTAQKAYAAAAGAGTSSGKGSGAERQYQVFSLSHDGSTPSSREITALLNSNFFNKALEQPMEVIGPDGNPYSIKNTYDATGILDMLGRQDIVDKFGVDPDKPEGTFTDAQGREVRVKKAPSTVSNANQMLKYGLKMGDRIYQVEYKDKFGKWQYDQSATNILSGELRDYQGRVNEWRKENNGVDLQHMTVKEQDWDKIAKKYNFSDKVPKELYPYVLATMANVGDRTPAYFMDSEMSSVKGTREGWARRLMTSYAGAHPIKDVGLDKSSDLMIHRIKKDGTIDKEGIRDYHKVLDNEELMSIQADPEDILNNHVHFLTDSGDYVVNPKAFGTDVSAAYREMRKPMQITLGDGTKVTDHQGIVHYLMKPLLEPSTLFDMTKEEQEDWGTIADAALGQFGFRADGVSPVAVVINPDAQQALRNAVVAFIDQRFGAVRDIRNNRKWQERSDSTSKDIEYDAGSLEE